MISKGGESNTTKSGTLSLDAIRESLRQLRKNQNERVNKGSETIPRPKFTDGLLGSANSAPVFGGTDSLPVFGKEREKKPVGESAAMKTKFVKMYTYGELGEKLGMLRPEEAKKAEKGFSFGEINERLMKLREIEQKDSESRIGGVFKDFRESLEKLQMFDEEKAKKSSTHRLDVLG